MKTKLIATLILAGSSLFAGHFSFGIGFGAPVYAPRPVYVRYAPPVYAYRPVAPGYGYSWVDGYYYPVGTGYAWRSGYWVRPPYAGAVWVGPRHYSGRYYNGYWRR